MYPYTQHLEVYCPASFGDREQKCEHRKAGITVALQVRFVRGTAKKEDSPRTSCPRFGKGQCTFSQAWKGGVGKDGPDQPLMHMPWLGACPMLGPGVAREGCQGG